MSRTPPSSCRTGAAPSVLASPFPPRRNSQEGTRDRGADARLPGAVPRLELARRYPRLPPRHRRRRRPSLGARDARDRAEAPDPQGARPPDLGHEGPSLPESDDRPLAEAVSPRPAPHAGAGRPLPPGGRARTDRPAHPGVPPPMTVLALTLLGQGTVAWGKSEAVEGTAEQIANSHQRSQP